MSPQFQSIQDEALKLTPDERKKLAERLLSSVQESIDPEIEESWFRAADERFQAYIAGQTEVFEVREVVETLRKKLK